MGWIGYDGAMDFSILIRTLELLPEETRLWAGAGIIIAACLVVAFETHFIARREAKLPASDILT